MKIRTVGGELFHAGGRTDRQTDTTKLIAEFRNVLTRLKKTKNFREGLTPFPTSVHLSLMTYETQEMHHAATF
jgi:hypothetical protein